MTIDNLKLRQEAASTVERRMLDMLLNYTPADKLLVEDVKFIAAMAKTYAFDAHEWMSL